MSAQLFNPESGKLVNIDTKQMATLKKAGWLDPNDEKVAEIQKKKAAEQKKAAATADKK